MHSTVMKISIKTRLHVKESQACWQTEEELKKRDEQHVRSDGGLIPYRGAYII